MSAFKLVTLPNLKVIRLLASEDIKLRKFTDVCMMGGKFVPPTVKRL